MNGKPVFEPDLGTLETPYWTWEEGSPNARQYYISAPQNFMEFSSGPKSMTTAVAPLGPMPEVPGVSPSGAPLTEGECLAKLQSAGG